MGGSDSWGASRPRWQGRGFLRALFAAALLAFVAAAGAQVREVTFAGVAYAGAANTIDARFPYSRSFEGALKAAGGSPYLRALEYMRATPARGISVTTNPIEELKGRDQALVVALVLSSETVSKESFGDIRKLFVLLRGQAVFFDFKTMTVVRAYPVSFGYVDNFNRDPTEAEILERLKLVYEGASGKPGIYARFASALANASVPQQTPRFLQVTGVTLAPDVVAGLPDSLKTAPTVYETWAADLVGEAISSRVGVPIVPYSKGQAIGKVMPMKVMDGEVYTLTLPKPDYEITVDLKGLKKVRYSQSAAGSAFIYGVFADIRIQEPVSGTTYLNTALKNGEVKVVPASQTYVDDFPAYYDSLNAMFVKLADAVAGKGNAWVKTAAATTDIEAQIAKTKELMNLCK